MMKVMAYAGVYTGVARALNNPWPMNLAAAAGVLISGRQKLAQLRKAEKDLDKVQTPDAAASSFTPPPYVEPSSGGAGGGMAMGGYLSGPEHGAGGIDINAEGREFDNRKEAVRKYGKDTFEMLNKMQFETGGPVRINKPSNTMVSQPARNISVNLDISSPVIDDTLLDDIIPRIREAVRRGERIS